MRVRLLMALAGLAPALVPQPAQAASARIAVVPDGTYTGNIFVALLQQHPAEAERDSVKAPALVLVAAGGAVGLASLFVLTSGSTPTLGSGTPPPPPGGGMPPPQIEWTPPPSESPGGAPAAPNGPGGTTPDPTELMPTTTTPEPVTMALLASGLAGMGGASLLRRRRQR